MSVKIAPGGLGGACYHAVMTCWARFACFAPHAPLLAGCGDYDGQAAGAGDETATTEQALHTQCGAGTNGSVQGVDVSYYQGNFNWA
jgi:hypothetical protein